MTWLFQYVCHGTLTFYAALELRTGVLHRAAAQSGIPASTSWLLDA
ncbi:MAG: hypothetical protein HY703_10665 [Gemmatimonadetes bacterium]|nr:hypothetical protein [Gemmatimonadota bacterium]